MFSIDLGGGAELRPLEPWRAEEFLAHMERARDHIKPWVGASFIAYDHVSEFDTVINPVNVEPTVQCTLFLKVKYTQN